MNGRGARDGTELRYEGSDGPRRHIGRAAEGQKAAMDCLVEGREVGAIVLCTYYGRSRRSETLLDHASVVRSEEERRNKTKESD